VTKRSRSRTCSTCRLQASCLPSGLGLEEARAFDHAVTAHRHLARGEYLYRAGAPLETVFAVRSGYLKSSVMHEDGREQITAFHMAGDLLGLDGIASGLHSCDATALEDCEVCDLPYPRLEALARSIPTLMRHFHRLMSREIVRDHGVMRVLATMRAESRVAAFLIGLSER